MKGVDTGTRKYDDKKPRISWRGDGQFFVVSSVTKKGEKHWRSQNLLINNLFT